MTAASSTNSTTSNSILPPSTSTTGQTANDFNDLDTNQFLKLLITEISNQDPLNPMDNNELVQQISTIRQISATTKLSDTLDAVTSGQNLSTASSMIGKKVNALTATGDPIEGVVDRVSVEVSEKDNSRQYFIQVGEEKIDLKNVREVYPAV